MAIYGSDGDFSTEYCDNLRKWKQEDEDEYKRVTLEIQKIREHNKLKDEREIKKYISDIDNRKNLKIGDFV